MVQKWPFFELLFLGIIGQENVFYDIPGRKNAFLGYKNKKFKKSKMAIFPKGLTHGLCQKRRFFQLFFLGNIGQENVFYDNLEQKNAFPGYKNMKFKKPKNGHFFKEGEPMVLIQKWPFFQIFFVGNICKENVFYDILEGKKGLPRL